MAGGKRRGKKQTNWLPAILNAGMAAGILAVLVWLVSSQSEDATRVPERQTATLPLPQPLPQPVIPPAPATGRNQAPERPRGVLGTQISLANLGFSPGSIDGVMGSQTRAALRAFQRRSGAPETGELNEATRQALLLAEASLEAWVVTQEDLAQLGTVPAGWLAKSEAATLPYESLLELVAERAWSHPRLVQSLNPQIIWTNVLAGTALQVPRVRFPPAQAKAQWIVIRLGARELQAFDSRTNLLAHFPCSIARRVEKRPVGELVVETVALRPNYRFDPGIFSESPEARSIGRPLMIPPGPNNPVGAAWIGLSKPGYGIHGTPEPEAVGRTESHGCFRLANWNAEYLARIVEPGTSVIIRP